MGDTVTAWVRDNPLALRYLARGLADGDAQVNAVFDALLGIAERMVGAARPHGGLADGVDQDWAALHVIVFNLASVLLEPAISRQLGRPFFAAEQLQRWNAATTELYRRGLGPA